jgi:hypothetical protein
MPHADLFLVFFLCPKAGGNKFLFFSNFIPFSTAYTSLCPRRYNSSKKSHANHLHFLTCKQNLSQADCYTLIPALHAFQQDVSRYTYQLGLSLFHVWR